MMIPIPNFSRYVATEDGNVYSLNYKNSGKTKIIKPSARDGYYQSMFLRDDGKYCTYKIHKMITLAFYGERKAGQQVNHIDGNKLNNSIKNLEYCTFRENIDHSVVNGLQKPRRGELNGMAKLTQDDVLAIRNHAKTCGSRYYGRKTLAEKYGVSPAHIKDIVTKRRNVWPTA